MEANHNVSLIGKPGFRNRIHTPALGVDLDIMEQNMRGLREIAAEHNVHVRPHAKAHKSPKIAKMQIAHGAVGICCATIGEAEVMAAGGISDVLITAPLATQPKLSRLSPLNAALSRLTIVVDTVDAVQGVSLAVKNSGKDLSVLIDVDVGQGRTGAIDASEVLAIAREIEKHSNLIFLGLQGYAGNLQSVKDYAQRAEKCAEVHAKLTKIREHLRTHGFECRVISGAGTGTLMADLRAGVFTEVQPGSYLFMDVPYGATEISPDRPHPFNTSLRFFTRIISAHHPGKATTDGGHKSMPADGPAPKVVAGAAPDTEYKYAGDEFGRIEYSDKEFAAVPGTLIECHVPHCDTSIAAHDLLVGFRGDSIETVFELTARGAW